MKRVIFATSNEGKMKEIRLLLADLDVEVLSLKEAGISVSIVEDGETFEENALIKVRTVGMEKEAQGAVILADDSGLEVDYLNKAPGVYSARYMGEDTSYTIKNQAIIEQLSKAVGEERSARFVCVIAALLPDGRTLTTRATIEGQIGYREEGSNGFGYDPILYLPEYHTTTAGLSMEEKNRISHRGKALRQMKERLMDGGVI
ncbi:MAG: RdgB/HAM1 family non-canonical purine NTP pyrophosphatase [Lachnospiraceae bacterium]|nr:RdgB/HAM1 family non-canonical purine NTP pyrophosphatase [Lachnospiraceae bacterium]